MSASVHCQNSSDAERVAPAGAASSPRQPWRPARPSSVERVDVVLRPQATPAEAAAQLWRHATACDFGEPAAWSLEHAPAHGVSAADMAAAAAFGGALCHLGTVVRCGSRALAWTGPTFVPRGYLLAGVADAHDAAVVRLADGRDVLTAVRLPRPIDSSAASMVLSLDTPSLWASWTSSPHLGGIAPPPWIVRITFPQVVPPPWYIARLLADAGLQVDHVHAPADRRAASSRWARLGAAPRADVSQAAAGLHRVHRVELQAWSVLQP